MSKFEALLLFSFMTLVVIGGYIYMIRYFLRTRKGKQRFSFLGYYIRARVVGLIGLAAYLVVTFFVFLSASNTPQHATLTKKEAITISGTIICHPGASQSTDCARALFMDGRTYFLINDISSQINVKTFPMGKKALVKGWTLDDDTISVTSIEPF